MVSLAILECVCSLSYAQESGRTISCAFMANARQSMQKNPKLKIFWRMVTFGDFQGVKANLKKRVVFGQGPPRCMVLWMHGRMDGEGTSSSSDSCYYNIMVASFNCHYCLVWAVKKNAEMISQCAECLLNISFRLPLDWCWKKLVGVIISESRSRSAGFRKLQPQPQLPIHSRPHLGDWTQIDGAHVDHLAFFPHMKSWALTNREN